MHKLPEKQLKQYAKVLKLLKPSKKLGQRKAKDVFEMQFAEVENMKRFIDSPDGALKAMSIMYDCPENLLVDYRLFQFYPALNHLTGQLEHIENIEKANLHKKPKPEMIEAGIKELDRFGALNVLDELAKDYGKSPMEVERWSYGLVYSLQWKRRIESEINDNWREAQKRNS